MSKRNNIIIFGTGKLATYLFQNLNINKINIVAFLDNDKNKWGKSFNDILIKKPEEIFNIQYDYILIASQYENEIIEQLIKFNINKNKIFCYNFYLNNASDYVKSKLEFFNTSECIYKTITTGISYSACAIKCDMLNKKGFSLANGSQDLYYDFKTLKYLKEKSYNKFKKIECCIIGISYYSFQYNLSLSAIKSKVFLYYNAFKDVHSYTDFHKNFIAFKSNNKIAEKVLVKKKVTLRLNKFKNISKEEKEYLGKDIAQRDCNKNYPNTVIENKQILKDYLKFLKDNNIKPVVVVCPATKYYTEHFSKRIEEEFHSIMSEIRKEYNFQYIDYFKSQLFDDEDFQDVSHLNLKGAEKFTKILNDIIEW